MSIASYIKEDLKTRLNSGEELPAKLTLKSLSKHYDVSFSPVRSALAELIEEGLIEKGLNKRLIPSSNIKVTGKSKKKDLPKPPQDMYEVIANDIVKLSLKGKAIDLREEATALKYGISRSSLRIIFNRLAGAGILNHIPRRGWRIRPFREEDMNSFLEMRELLELKALELARPHLLNEDLQRMLDGNSLPEPNNEKPLVDNSIHSYLINKAGNIYFKDFFERQGKYYDILFDWEEQDQEIAIQTVNQHRAILNALLKKDYVKARKALSFHIHNNHPILGKIKSR